MPGPPALCVLTHLVIEVVVQVVSEQQVHECLLAYGVVAEDGGAVEAEEGAAQRERRKGDVELADLGRLLKGQLCIELSAW